MTNAEKRDSNIELYRCLLTIGIVILHTIGFYGKEYHWLSSAFTWCVPGFVFISGYFGIRFSIWKVIKLYGICLWCFPVSILVGQYVQGEIAYTSGLYYAIIKWLGDSWTAFMRNWFVHAYIGLMMIVPIVDNTIANIINEKPNTRARDFTLLMPFLFFVFVWSFFSYYNCMSAFLPKAPSCSVLTLLGIYVIARIFRACDFENRIPTFVALIIFALGISFAMLRLGTFNSVVSLGIAIGSFVLIRSVRLSPMLSSSAILAGPSMFSVFLIHCNKWCLESMHNFVDFVAARGIPKVLSFFIVAIIIFFGGLILDIPRRVIGRIVVSRLCR